MAEIKGARLISERWSREYHRVSAEVRVAGRALAKAGLVHAYGHCSHRLADTLIASPPRPLGLAGAAEECPVVPFTDPLPPGVMGEIRMHRAVYRDRPDVNGICRVQPPAVMALSVLGRVPRIVHGFSSYFSPAVPFFDSPVLVRDNETAARVSAALGDAPAIILRGNGALIVADDLRKAVCLAWYLEDAARVELAIVSSAADARTLTEDEVRQRAVWDGRLAERMWDFLTAGDPELQPERD